MCYGDVEGGGYGSSYGEPMDVIALIENVDTWYRRLYMFVRSYRNLGSIAQEQQQMLWASEVQNCTGLVPMITLLGGV